jgi:hypothetical protein
MIPLAIRTGSFTRQEAVGRKVNPHGADDELVNAPNVGPGEELVRLLVAADKRVPIDPARRLPVRLNFKPFAKLLAAARNNAVFE